MTDTSHSLYKSTGITHDTPGVSPATPQEVAEKIYGKPSGVKAFGRIELISVVDRRLDDKAHRMLALIQACAWKKPLQASFEEIAFAVSCSRMTAIRHLHSLEQFGYVTVARKHNRRNEYSTALTGKRVGPAGEMVSEPRKVVLSKCLKCNKIRKTSGMTGWCPRCTKDSHTRQVVREEISRIA